MRIAQWAAEEAEGAALPDRRLQARLATLLKELSQDPERSIPAACGDWAATLAAYRFFDNPRVSFDGILAGHRQTTLDRIRRVRRVLVVQDTTTLTYERWVDRQLGTLSDRKRQRCFLHASAAFCPNGVNLGVVHATTWRRMRV